MGRGEVVGKWVVGVKGERLTDLTDTSNADLPAANKMRMAGGRLTRNYIPYIISGIFSRVNGYFLRDFLQPIGPPPHLH